MCGLGLLSWFLKKRFLLRGCLKKWVLRFLGPLLSLVLSLFRQLKLRVLVGCKLILCRLRVLRGLCLLLLSLLGKVIMRKGCGLGLRMRMFMLVILGLRCLGGLGLGLFLG